MSKIQGKQIANSTITQGNLNLYDPIYPKDAATKDYVDTQRSVEHLALSNKDMTAVSTVGLSGVNLACAKPVMETPVSKSQMIVYVNNVPIDAGPTKHAFFSADSGITRKQNNEIVIGDYLYWDNDTAPYELESDDEIDFVYLRSGDSREEGDIIIDGGGV